MKRRIANGRTAKLDRFQLGNGRQRARASDLHTNIQQLRCCLSRAELDVQVIDFDHHAVNLIIELVPPFFPIPAKVDDLIQRMTQLPMRIDLETKLHHPLQVFRLKPLRRMDPVPVKIQLSLRRNCRIQLPQRSRSRVPRIRKPRFARLFSLFIQLTECFQGEKHLPANLDRHIFM